MDDNYQDWTQCEMHGHEYQDGRCVDCGEEQEKVMKSDELLAQLADITAKYGPIPVRVYNSDYVGYSDEDAPSWQVAEITTVDVNGMEVELWV